MENGKGEIAQTGQVLVTVGESEAVFSWLRFERPADLQKALFSLTEYFRNGCVGNYESGDVLVEPLSSFISFKGNLG